MHLLVHMVVTPLTAIESVNVGANRGKAVGVLVALNSMRVHRDIDRNLSYLNHHKVAHAEKKLGDVPSALNPVMTLVEETAGDDPSALNPAMAINSPGEEKAGDVPVALNPVRTYGEEQSGNVPAALNPTKAHREV